MKAIKLIATITLFATIVLLFSCSDKKQPATAGTSTDQGTATIDENIEYTGKIAYIRMDSLMKGYGMYIDLSDDFTKKGQQVEQQLTQRGRSLEREAMAYQEQMQKGVMSRFEAQTAGEELQKKEQALLAYRDQMMQDLQEQEISISSKISEIVLNYIKEYNATRGYSMILQTAAGNPIIIADPAYDITNDIVTELNKRYLEERGTAKKIEAAQKEDNTAK